MYALIFHANLQYAEISKSELHRVITKSYIPNIKKLLNNEIPFALNITGFSLKLLPKKLISLIKEGIETQLIEITATSYTHAILPLLSLDRMRAQIEEDLRAKENFLNYKPNIFWPPELGYDPILPAILKDLKIDEVFVDGEALLLSKYMNIAIQKIDIPYIRLFYAAQGERKYINYIRGLYNLKKALSYVLSGKVKLLGVKNIIGIPVWQPVNIILMLGLGRFPLMNERKSARLLKKIKNIIIYGSDLEFFGYMPFGGKVMNIDSLITLIKRESLKLTHPSKLPNNDMSFYLKTSSWAPDKSLKIWKEDEDNERLNLLSRELDGKYAFLAENSDSRGWVPIPERRLDAFRAIYKNWREKNE